EKGCTATRNTLLHVCPANNRRLREIRAHNGGTARILSILRESDPPTEATFDTQLDDSGRNDERGRALHARAHGAVPRRMGGAGERQRHRSTRPERRASMVETGAWRPPELAMGDCRCGRPRSGMGAALHGEIHQTAIYQNE